MSASKKELIKITYNSPGACPPIYVAGSFTVPEWQPQLLEHRIRKDVSNGSLPEYEFFKFFRIGVGTWQYKFRLGSTDDWWACDEHQGIGLKKRLYS